MIVFILNREDTHTHRTLGRHGLAFSIWMGKHGIWPGILHSHTACPAAFAECDHKRLGGELRSAPAHGEARGL